MAKTSFVYAGKTTVMVSYMIVGTNSILGSNKTA